MEALNRHQVHQTLEASTSRIWNTKRRYR